MNESTVKTKSATEFTEKTREKNSKKLCGLCGERTFLQWSHGMDYFVFAKRSGEDDEFVKDVETKISKTWEADLADWEFCHEGIEDWTKKLQDITEANLSGIKGSL